MIEIKICGITNKEDALTACEAGADAVGFIFYPQSPRYILPEQAKKIIQALPPEICRVGVFVNLDLLNLNEISTFCNLDLIQLHGDESTDYCRKLPASRLIKSLSPVNEQDVDRAEDYPTKAILVDSRTHSKYGGTGQTVDWNLAAKMKSKRPLILAGGLKAENVAVAIAAVGPDALDFCSGVESMPRQKDPEKIRSVIEIVRRSSPASGGEQIKIFTRTEIAVEKDEQKTIGAAERK
jgi:phosphoribosylanthranilate isomerase